MFTKILSKCKVLNPLQVTSKPTFQPKPNCRNDLLSSSEMTNPPKVLLEPQLVTTLASPPSPSGRLFKWALLGVLASALGYWGLRHYR